MDEPERLPDEDELAERGRLLVARAVAETRAPDELRERLAGQAAASAPRPLRPRARGRIRDGAAHRPRLRLFAWAAGGLAVLALLAVLASGDGEPRGGPSVLAVAKATAAGADGAAPRPVTGGFVDARIGAVRFPDWTDVSWPATGQRRDRVGGRDVRTVFYAAPDGTTAAYAVVDGPPLEVPDTARERRVRGTAFRVLDADAERILTWEEGGQTCVLRAPASVPEDRLLALAAWEPA
jgi:hypothetical protein